MINSEIEAQTSLRELIDPASFKEICIKYFELFKVNIQVFSSDGKEFAQAKKEPEICQYLSSVPFTKTKCLSHISKIKNFELSSSKKITSCCFSGCRYKIAPITYNSAILGRVIFGPFVVKEKGYLSDIQKLNSKIDLKKAELLLEKLPKMDLKTLEQIVDHFISVIEVILFNGHKALLTSRMHIASIRDSYRELSQRNKELQESYQKLKELDQMKSNFLATVSHELRTPLTSIIGYSEMLLEGLAGELKRDQQDFIKTIMEKGEHLLGLITSLLEISKMEIGQVTLERKDTNITELCKDAILTIKPEAVKRGLKLEMNLEKEMPSVSLDKDRMRQVLLNLLSNALKFTPKGGSILLEAKISEVQSERKDPVGLVLSSPTRKILELAVHDTGIGIPPDKLSQIFEPFFQVDGTSTRKYEGTGLGLSIVKRIVEAHNGEIKVKSTLNQGSSFFVTIPLEQEQE